MFTWTSLSKPLAKPGASTLTLYVPGIKSVMVYVPAEVVIAVLDMFVPVFVTVTLAPGTTAPEGSVIVPVRPRRGTKRKQRLRKLEKIFISRPLNEVHDRYIRPNPSAKSNSTL